MYQRIFYTGENKRPDFTTCDYAFSFDYRDSPYDYRLPVYVLCGDPRSLIKGKDFDAEKIIKEKTKFCNFVYSNRSAQKRIRFFQKLSRYKRVDSGGMVLNNIGGPVASKLDFIRDYKFTIAFENVSYPGYTTEKIFEPMMVHSLPIYWGNKLVHRDFNTTSFLNYHDFENEDALIERIIEIDNNDDLYRRYLSQPCFPGNAVPEFIQPENVLRQFDFIFNNKKLPVARRKRRFFFFLAVKWSEIFRRRE